MKLLVSWVFASDEFLVMGTLLAVAGLKILADSKSLS